MRTILEILNGYYKEVLWEFWNQKALWLLLLCLLVFGVIFLKQRKKPLYYIAIYSLLVMIIGIFNPLFPYLIYVKSEIMPNFGTYVRYFFVIPVFLFIVACFVEGMDYIQSGYSKQIFLIVVLVTAVLLGSRNMQDTMAPNENIYKIQQEPIDVANIILGDANLNDGEYTHILCGVNYSTLSVEAGIDIEKTVYFEWCTREHNLLIGIRQYAPQIKVVGPMVDYNTYVTEGMQEVSKCLQEQEDKDYQYIACDYSPDMKEDLEQLGYLFVGQTENYMVLKK